MRVYVIILVLLVCLGTVSALQIEKYSATLELQKGYATQEVVLNIINNLHSPVYEFKYPFFGYISNVVVYGNGTVIPFTIEGSGQRVYIKANLSRKLGFNGSYTLKYVYNISGIVERKDDLYILTTTYPLFANVKNFNLSVFLPPGYGLAKNVISMSPEGKSTSNGRIVILKWELHEPIPDEFRNFRVIVLYERLITVGNSLNSFILSILIFSVILILIFISFKKRKFFGALFDRQKRLKEKIGILKDDEQTIMKLVIENNGIDQREIVRQTGFSKTKVSKILSELEKRGAIVKKPVGRRNKIYIVDKE